MRDDNNLFCGDSLAEFATYVAEETLTQTLGLSLGAVREIIEEKSLAHDFSDAFMQMIGKGKSKFKFIHEDCTGLCVTHDIVRDKDGPKYLYFAILGDFCSGGIAELRRDNSPALDLVEIAENHFNDYGAALVATSGDCSVTLNLKNKTHNSQV